MILQVQGLMMCGFFLKKYLLSGMYSIFFYYLCTLSIAYSSLEVVMTGKNYAFIIKQKERKNYEKEIRLYNLRLHLRRRRGT